MSHIVKTSFDTIWFIIFSNNGTITLLKNDNYMLLNIKLVRQTISIECS